MSERLEEDGQVGVAARGRHQCSERASTRPLVRSFVDAGQTYLSSPNCTALAGWACFAYWLFLCMLGLHAWLACFLAGWLACLLVGTRGNLISHPPPKPTIPCPPFRLSVCSPRAPAPCASSACPVIAAAMQHKGNTPLHFCFTYGYGDTRGAYLTSKGADPSIRNNFGLTCYEGLGGSKGSSTPT